MLVCRQQPRLSAEEITSVQVLQDFPELLDVDLLAEGHSCKTTRDWERSRCRAKRTDRGCLAWFNGLLVRFGFGVTENGFTLMAFVLVLTMNGALRSNVAKS